MEASPASTYRLEAEQRAAYPARGNGAGHLVYAAATTLALVSAPVSLGLRGLAALAPARAHPGLIASAATLRSRLTLAAEVSKVCNPPVQIGCPALG